jgi:hypothetical protein
MYLPLSRNLPRKRIEIQPKFSGLDHRPGREDGSIFDMRNLTARDFPVLATRSRRAYMGHIDNINGFGYFDKPFWASGTQFIYGGEFKGNVSAGEKSFSEIGQVIIIMPDKLYYNIATDVFGAIDTIWAGPVQYMDGTIAGNPAVKNTIRSLGDPFPYEIMDTVVISGNTTFPDNDKPEGITVIEVSSDKMELHFYENTFSSLGSASEDIGVTNTMPDLDIVFECGNRLWGAKGDNVYASRLDDFKNWNTFFGVATDSWNKSSRTRGDFTAGIAYKGYPTFFKEMEMYRVYGSSALDFDLSAEAHIGVADGAAQSLAIAGEALIYYSPDGFVASYGGTPQLMGAPLGDNLKYSSVIAAGDASRYWASTIDSENAVRLYTYNTGLNLWHIEDAFDALAFDYDKGRVYAAEKNGDWWIIGEQATPLPEGAAYEGAFEGFAEFAAYTLKDTSKRSVNKVLLTIDFPGDISSWIKIWIRYDSMGEYKLLRTLTPAAIRSHKIPVTPQRKDHFQIKITGRGDWRVYNLTYLYIDNSYNRSALGGMAATDN